MVAPSHVLVFDLGSQRAGFLPKDDLDVVCASIGSRLGKAALLHEALLPVCCWLGWEFGPSPTREFLFCTQSWLNTRWHHQVCLGTGGSEQQGHKPSPGGINQGCTSLCTPISYGEHGPCRNPEGFTAAHGGFGDERCIFSCKMQWGFAPAAGADTGKEGNGAGQILPLSEAARWGAGPAGWGLAGGEGAMLSPQPALAPGWHPVRGHFSIPAWALPKSCAAAG